MVISTVTTPHLNRRRRAVFLDRDGVLNHPVIRNAKCFAPQRIEDFQLIDGVREACDLLKQAGYLLVVATNQPDVAIGKQRRETIEQMHRLLRTWLPVDDIRVCYHSDADRCACRKPLPGMLLEAAYDLDIDLTQSFMVGDRWRDVEAGQRAGCRCFFINYHYQEKHPQGQFETVIDLRDVAIKIK